MWDKIVHIPFLATWRVQMPRKGFHDWLSDFCSKQVALIWCLMSLYRYTGITALTTSGLYSQISGFSDIIWIHFILRTSATFSVHLFLLSCNPWNLLISFDNVIPDDALWKPSENRPSCCLPLAALASPWLHQCQRFTLWHPASCSKGLGTMPSAMWHRMMSHVFDNSWGFQKLSTKMLRDWHKRKKNHRIIENPTKGNVRYWFG